MLGSRSGRGTITVLYLPFPTCRKAPFLLDHSAQSSMIVIAVIKGNVAFEQTIPQPEQSGVVLTGRGFPSLANVAQTEPMGCRTRVSQM